MAIIRLKRTKKVENKEWIGIDGSVIDPSNPDAANPSFQRTESSILVLNPGSFPEYRLERTETHIKAIKV